MCINEYTFHFLKEQYVKAQFGKKETHLTGFILHGHRKCTQSSINFFSVPCVIVDIGALYSIKSLAFMDARAEFLGHGAGQG